MAESDRVDYSHMERGGNGNSNGKFISQTIESEEALRNVLTNTMSISPELFEKLYLFPKNEVKGDLRKTFANPTPMAIMGFSVGVLPLSIELSTSSSFDRSSTRLNAAYIRSFTDLQIWWDGAALEGSQQRQRVAPSSSAACFS